MYQIKCFPQDFLVKEIPLYNPEPGQYSYFWMKKTTYTTITAIQTIARALNINPKNIGFAGTKDKTAITEQVISIKSISWEKIKNLNLKDIKLSYISDGKTPLSLGDLKGNEFMIAVRNISPAEIKKAGEKSKHNIPNLFGPQRFSKNNAEIGKAILKKDFKSAVNLIDHESVKEFLKKYPNNCVGALRTLPKKLLKIYIHAYQSLLWNRTAEEYLKTRHNPENIKLPILGFAAETESIKDSALKEIILDILNKEQLAERDFIIRQIPELSSEGGERELFIRPENFSIQIEDDELNKGKFKAIVSFSLPKGSYATTVIEFIFQQSPSLS